MLDALVERCPVTGARAVVHLKGLAGNREPLCHAQDRCDPNAASEQHAGFCLVREREMILGRADREHVPLIHLLVHGLRASARRGVLQHAYPIQAALKGRVAK